MHSDLELGTVLRSYLFINFLPQRGARDYRQEFKDVLKRNGVKVWSEIGYEILGQV